ncbi:M23 family metallopeptidase [Saccharomonospora sp. NPDC006951]
MLAPAAAGQHGRPVADPRFSWPLSPSPVVSRPFDRPGHAYGPGHRGVDLAARENQEVLAAGAGLVLYAGPLAGRGVVSIEHDGGLRTTYEPVSPRVAVGDQVHQGQVIGTVVAGHAGCATDVCLHWGVRRVTEYLDPLRLVRTGTPLRLKPWEGVDAGQS